ncbi:MAG: N-formylglutamate amidohydrolase [Chloroflexi bacterium]|nr:N-formylglutamate amidohydrolase [Chloroflexota bacterium]
MHETLPIAIVLPHAGQRIPQEVENRLALSEVDIFNEADIYTEMLFDFRERVRHWLYFPYARAVIDVNRPDNKALTRPGDGIVKRITSYRKPVYRCGKEPDAELEKALIERYWRPWHQRLAELARDSNIKLVLDCHSMAAVGPKHYDDPNALRPRACVSNLGDANGEMEEQRARLSSRPDAARTLAAALAAVLADAPALARTGEPVRINSPFRGGWDIWAHGGRHQAWFMLEISRALYVGEQNAHTPVRPPNLERLADLRERIWKAIVTAYERL